jgi:pimeloyl-ACP methyl ester carboxylesterase
MPSQQSFEQVYARVDEGTRRSLLAFRRDHPLIQIQVDGVIWHYVAYGQGEETVLFLLGMAGAYDIWWQVLETLKDRFQMVSLTYPPVQGLKALDVPVMILEADNDPLVNGRLREMLKTTYPSATVHTLTGAGHFPYLSKPALYAQVLQQFPIAEIG